MMIALGTPQTSRLQSQIGEGLSHIAALDFPSEWEGLCDVSCSNLIIRLLIPFAGTCELTHAG